MAAVSAGLAAGMVAEILQYNDVSERKLNLCIAKIREIIAILQFSRGLSLICIYFVRILNHFGRN